MCLAYSLCIIFMNQLDFMGKIIEYIYFSYCLSNMTECDPRPQL